MGGVSGTGRGQAGVKRRGWLLGVRVGHTKAEGCLWHLLGRGTSPVAAMSVAYLRKSKMTLADLYARIHRTNTRWVAVFLEEFISAGQFVMVLVGK